jgi:hypothetical protein
MKNKPFLFFIIIMMCCCVSCQKDQVSADSNFSSGITGDRVAVAAATPATITDLFRNSGRLFEMFRNSKGIYRDSKLFSGTDYHPCSVANIGMGLISLCIAQQMGWTTTGAAQVKTTLNTVLGNDPSFHLDRNAAGFPRHFVDMNTGAQAWTSEYSTIDAAIMVEGALFCKKYFSSDATIASLADQLYKSINWSKAIADANNGKIWLSLDASGNGIGGKTSVYNEYINVAYLAWKSENGGTGPGTTLWNKFYATPAAMLPQKNYWGFNTLTDNTSHFLASFIPQFSYYLCHPYTVNTTYKNFGTASMNADKKWWTFQSVAAYEWGLGAGTAPSGYHADAIDDNADKMVSPHIVAGFIPFSSTASTDFMSLYTAGKAVYNLPGTSYPILWRYSITNTTYRTPSVSGVDFASELFGLASLPSHCGTSFFSNNNNFSFPTYSFVPVP